MYICVKLEFNSYAVEKSENGMLEWHTFGCKEMSHFYYSTKVVIVVINKCFTKLTTKVVDSSDEQICIPGRPFNDFGTTQFT